jgi:DNA repair protein RecO (recombination protein O)
LKSGKKEVLEGLIIQSFPYGENHKIIHLFTKNQGLLSLLAHGARKPKSKTRGKVETLNHIECLAHQTGKNPMRTLLEAQVKQSFAPALPFEALWQTLPFLKLFRLIHFSSEEENEKIFLMLLKLLEALKHSQDKANRELLLEAFVLKTWVVTGMMPNPRFCSLCGKPASGKTVFFDPGNLSVTCGPCSNAKQGIRSLNPDFYEKLIQILYLKFDELIYLMLNEPEARSLKILSGQVLLNTTAKGWWDFEAGENPFSDES